MHKHWHIREITQLDYLAIRQIYSDGLATGIASFETKVPDWTTWDQKYHRQCRFLLEEGSEILAWAALTPVSTREVYKGGAEISIYVNTSARGQGCGYFLLQHLIKCSEAAGFWTLQASIFSENKASIHLHEKAGFRMVGYRERIAQRDGQWHDNVLMERRR
ncbi:MAG: phosphinothricin N-acetyltransferase [Saprospiraceae bacterium]|nr:MAG: phosphinothricin N-acetyltransferase [Saprospiraceae bacterium]